MAKQIDVGSEQSPEYCLRLNKAEAAKIIEGLVRQLANTGAEAPSIIVSSDTNFRLYMIVE